MDRIDLGSRTARGGIANEREIVRKFNNWREDEQAKEWLRIMGYELDKIKDVTAFHIPTRISTQEFRKYCIREEDFYNLAKFKKADAQVKLTIYIGNIVKIENISIKKANSNSNYNQIDKRPVSAYKEMWHFDDDVELWLKLFTGEKIPKNHLYLLGNRKIRNLNERLYLEEMPPLIIHKIINFFSENKILIVSDLLKGRGGLSADWILVTRYNTCDNTIDWTLQDINTAMNFYGNGSVEISPHGSLYIGKITMQRKGGTPDPTSLQFKFSPCDLFELHAQHG